MKIAINQEPQNSENLLFVSQPQQEVSGSNKLPSPVSVLAHEVRNPLTNISLALEMLKRIGSTPEQATYLAIIKRAAKRVDNLICTIVKEQQPDTELSDCNIHSIIDQVLDLADDRRILKNAVFVRQYCESDYTLFVNSQKMRIAFTNIVINSIDALPINKGELKVKSFFLKNKFKVEFRDNGCGIGRGDVKHIFDPFFTRKSTGLGIGLAATYAILKSNNVKINVHSKVNTGTNFILTFPAVSTRKS